MSASAQTVPRIGNSQMRQLFGCAGAMIEFESELGTRNTKTSYFVFRVYRYKHEKPMTKHETNTKTVETRNKHENWKFTYTPKLYHSPLRSRGLFANSF